MIDIQDILDAVVSHAQTTGYFDRVNSHEPKSAPGNGLTCAVWVQAVEPARGTSGLSQTSVRLTLNVRLYSSMLQEPQDAIDPNMVMATDALMDNYSGEFLLGIDQVRSVDLLGYSGTPMRADAGYLSIDNRMMRVMTITVPLVLNDVWEQVA